jgi:hypothetical protein
MTSLKPQEWESLFVIKLKEAALTLDSKLDVKTKNLKGFLHELTEQAMDCCWEHHSILSFTTAGGTNMSLLLEDYGNIPLATIKAVTVVTA